jgi:hypothetical protein
MNREYTRGEFEQVADGLNEHLAGIDVTKLYIYIIYTFSRREKKV